MSSSVGGGRTTLGSGGAVFSTSAWTTVCTVETSCGIAFITGTRREIFPKASNRPRRDQYANAPTRERTMSLIASADRNTIFSPAYDAMPAGNSAAIATMARLNTAQSSQEGGFLG